MANWHIRQTQPSDRQTVDSLLANSERRHLHLDWLDPTELTGRQPFLLATEDGRPVACLAAPPDIPGIAWLRAFALASGRPPIDGWERLWPRAVDELLEQRVEQVVAMALDAWLAKLLKGAGFAQVNAVVFLELQIERPPQSEPSSRPITIADLERVLALDTAAFGPMWRLSAESMRAALRQASSATLIQVDDTVVGYQITTASPFSVHLARLAVHPKWHRRGMGRSLVEDSIRTAAQQPFGRLSVNTQADNAASLALYRRLGFEQTGQQFPVYATNLTP